ncbi:MAG: hypothetical protein ACHQ6U_02270 [Thermodesulfobacteriota bacterium]
MNTRPPPPDAELEEYLFSDNNYPDSKGLLDILKEREEVKNRLREKFLRKIEFEEKN